MVEGTLQVGFWKPQGGLGGPWENLRKTERTWGEDMGGLRKDSGRTQ